MIHPTLVDTSRFMINVLPQTLKENTKYPSAETGAGRAKSPGEADGLRGAKARRRRWLAGKEPGRPAGPAKSKETQSGSATRGGKQGEACGVGFQKPQVPEAAKQDKDRSAATVCRLVEPRRSPQGFGAQKNISINT